MCQGQIALSPVGDMMRSRWQIGDFRPFGWERSRCWTTCSPPLSGELPLKVLPIAGASPAWNSSSAPLGELIYFFVIELVDSINK